MKLQPLYDKILIKPLEDASYQGNIIIPDTGKERPEKGEVVAVGPGFYTIGGTLIKNQLKPGQMVIVPKLGAQMVTIDNEEYLICKESDVIAQYEQDN